MILGIISKESIYSQSKVGIISKYLLGIIPANENTDLYRSRLPNSIVFFGWDHSASQGGEAIFQKQKDQKQFSKTQFSKSSKPKSNYPKAIIQSKKETQYTKQSPRHLRCNLESS